jgi:hypothetical protein
MEEQQEQSVTTCFAFDPEAFCPVAKLSQKEYVRLANLTLRLFATLIKFGPLAISI